MSLQCYVLLVLVSMFIHSNTNTINCLGTDACFGQTLNCNANQPCIINCDSHGGDKACGETTINQNDATTMTVNCLNYMDCYYANIYCGAGGCTVNCGFTGERSNCVGGSVICGAGHCLSMNSQVNNSWQCTNINCPTSNPTHNPTHKPTSQPTSNPVIISSKAPTKNPTTSQHTTISPTTHMPSTSVRTTDISTTDISTSYMGITTVLTTNMPTSSMYTTPMPTDMPTDIPTSLMPTTNIPSATPIKHGIVNEIYTTDISNESELTINAKKESNILIYIILTIGSILCCCFLCICVPKKYNKNKNKKYTNKEQNPMEIEIEVTNVVDVNDVLMNGVVNEMNGVMIVTSDGPIVNNETNDGTFAKNSAPNNSDDDYEILSDEIFNGVNTLHGENDYRVNEKGTHEGHSNVEYDEQYMDPVLN